MLYLDKLSTKFEDRIKIISKILDLKKLSSHHPFLGSNWKKNAMKMRKKKKKKGDMGSRK